MICGYNDWDALLDEAYMRDVLEGRIQVPPPTKPATLEDYARYFVVTSEDLEI